MTSAFAAEYAKSMNSEDFPAVDVEYEMANLAFFIEPMLIYPDQQILALTVNRNLLLYSSNKQEVLLSQMDSKNDLWASLGQLSPDADILTNYILELLVQSVIPQQRPMSLLIFDKLYTVEPQFITTMEGSRNLILSLVPDTPYHEMAPSAHQPPLEPLSRHAAKFNLQLNDYVSSCRNDMYYKRVSVSDAPSYTRRGSQMGEFIPSMHQPSVTFYPETESDAEEQAKLIDSFYNVPQDPDTLPPSFAISNTSNTGQTGPEISKKSQQAANAAKHCFACGTDKSPEWRRGPEGPKTLCNACGLRYAKQLRAGQ